MGMGLTLQELIQAGNIGIINAIEKFDYRKNVLFSTYAFYWIQKTIQTAIEKETGVISVPTYVLYKLRRYYQLKDELSFKLGKNANVHDVAKELYPSEKDLKKRQSYETEINKAIQAASLIKFSQNENIAFLKDSEDISPEYGFIQKQSRNEVLALMKYLSDKERNVIIRKLGLDGKPSDTFEKIGAVLDITKQGARKIFINAINKMKKLYTSTERNGKLSEL